MLEQTGVTVESLLSMATAFSDNIIWSQTITDISYSTWTTILDTFTVDGGDLVAINSAVTLAFSATIFESVSHELNAYQYLFMSFLIETNVGFSNSMALSLVSADFTTGK
jgi:hypothetical protein